MRKWFVFLLAVCLLLMPMLAHAQSSVTIDNLSVRLWPEHDTPEVLVWHTFSLAEDTVLPVEITFKIPPNITPSAVARDTTPKPVTIPHEMAALEDGWSAVTFSITDTAEYRLEYYAPLDKDGDTRSFTYEWKSDYIVNNLAVEFEQPPSATNLSITPTLNLLGESPGGVIYYKTIFSDLPANEVFSISFSYDKDNDDLTVSAMPIEVEGAEEKSNDSFSLTDSLPIILVGAGIALIVGGVWFFIFSGRHRSDEPTPRKRHKPRTASAGGNVYCHECGKRARSGDKFCRSCGVRLRSQ